MALDNRECLSCKPSDDEWQALYDVSKKQSLIGIAFAGIEKLPLEQCPAKMMVLKWNANVNKINYNNENMSSKCENVTKYFDSHGFYSCVLKGQSNLANYPEEIANYRSPGDIDILVAPKHAMKIELHDKKHNGKAVELDGKEAVIEFILEHYRRSGNDTKMPEVNYHHVDWGMEGTEVEVHFRASWMNSPFNNRRLQKWCNENAQWEKVGYNGYFIPTVEFNVIYQIVHVYRHLFNEGIGLRQLLDYYMVLKAWERKNAGDKGRAEMMRVLNSFGMKRFAEAVMWVLNEVFDGKSEDKGWMLCAPNKECGEFLLNEVMLSGNFGKYDERNVVKSGESYIHRFIRRQRRFLRFFTQYPSEVFWGPYFTFSQRWWRISNGYR